MKDSESPRGGIKQDAETGRLEQYAPA
jgi:hypothetical protein